MAENVPTKDMVISAMLSGVLDRIQKINGMVDTIFLKIRGPVPSATMVNDPCDSIVSKIQLMESATIDILKALVDLDNHL